MRPHTDIVATGWVARLPRPWLPYLLLARIDRPIGIWLLFLPGLWGILLSRPAPIEALRLILLFASGAIVMRAAGCVVNDLWDRDIDRLVARTASRPLASGMLRPRQALVFLAFLLLIGLAILLQLNPLAQLLGAGSLLLVALYPLAKRVTWWPQLVMGFTFGFGAPLGYAAGADRLDAAGVVLYGVAILWDLGFDTIYAHQDREDDALVGVRSTARLFGERTASVPRGMLWRLPSCCSCWPAGWQDWAPGSIRCSPCPQPFWRGKWPSLTCMIRGFVCGSSEPTARQDWRLARRYWSGGCPLIDDACS